MSLASWYSLAWYGPAAAAIVDTGVGSAVAGIKGTAQPDATIAGVGVVADADATRLVNSPATLTGLGALITAAPRGRANPSLTVSIGSRPSAVDNAEATVAQKVHPLGDMSIGDALAFLVRVARNKTVTDPASGVIRVYDDDDTTLLYEADLWENAAGTTPYAGNGAERRDRLA